MTRRDKRKIFISYSRKDLDIVRQLVLRIQEESNVYCWIDWNGIESGEQFEDVIVKAIDDCEIVIFMLSQSSMNSYYAKKEITYAYNIGKKIIPIIIDKSNLQGWFLFKFGDLDYIDSTNELQMNKLFHNLKDFAPSASDGVTMESGNMAVSVVSEKMTLEEIVDLAESYFYGDGGKEQDYALAMKYFEKAALLGDIESINRFADLLMDSRYHMVDYSKALYWYQRGWELGNSHSAYRLGVMYENGMGVDKDLDMAFSYYRKSADKNDTDGLFSQASCHLYGNGTEINLDKALSLYLILAERGYPNAWNNLGVCYERKGDYINALVWYKKAAQEGIACAQLNVGIYYHHGYGVDADYNEAIKWIQKAADQNDSSALNYLGIYYENGYVVDKNYSEAAALYKRSAELGNCHGQNNYGFCLLNGKGVESDARNAVRWFKKSMSLGFSYAYYNLAFCYEHGYGVNENINRACELYQSALSMGLEMAKEPLSRLINNNNL